MVSASGLLCFCWLAAFQPLAADLMVYPAQGQPPEQQTADQQQLLGKYIRAYGACLEGRGYTMKYASKVSQVSYLHIRQVSGDSELANCRI